jgi:MYXO-CTERM domain-containing protein
MQRGLVAAVLLVAGAASAGTVQGSLVTDTTWTVAGGPYTLTGDVTVPAGVTLTVEPGVQVIAAATDGLGSGTDTTKVELIARGTLRVLGTASSPVTFKGSSTGPGKWYGIRVVAGTTSVVSGALISDASTGLEVTGSGTSATLSSSTLTANTNGASVSASGTLAVDHTVVQSNSNAGIQANAGTANLQYNTLVSNGIYGLYVTNAASNVTLQNSIVTGNAAYGLYRVNGGTVTLSYNDVWGNVSSDYTGVSAGPNSFSFNPLFVSSSNFRLTSYSPARKAGSDGTSDIGALPYTGDVTPLLAGAIYEDTTFSGALSLAGDLTVTPGVTVTFAPGTTLTAAASDQLQSGADTTKVELIARGTLRVLGTASSPVTFKGSSTGPGKWYGIRVVAGTTSTLSGALIRDASTGLEVTGSGTSATLSSSTLTANTNGASVSASGTLAMDHTVAQGNSNAGIQANAGTANLQYNTLVANGVYGLYVINAASNVTLQNSIVTGNAAYGITRSNTGTVTLSYNDVWGNSANDYLGISAGPNSLSSNPLFISATDFHLQATSPCRGVSSAGTDIGALPYDEMTVASVEIVPTSVTVNAAGTTAFLARAYNSAGGPINDAVFTWSAKAAAGTISATGQLTASCSVGTIPAAVTATSANGVSASATVTLVPGAPAQVTVAPSATGIEAGASQSFTATVKDGCGNVRTGDPLTWSTASGAGTITASGQYTAPCTPGTYNNALSARVGSASGSATVFVSTGPLARLTLSPESPSVFMGGQQTFTAVPTDGCGNTRPDTVSWALTKGGGTLSASGVFTAGTQPGFYSDTVQASAGSQVARTSVTVLGGPIASLELTPSSATLSPSGQVTFTARARDASGNEVPATPSWAVIHGGGSITSAGVFTAGTLAGTYTQTVRAVAGSASATATVTVQPGPAERIELSPSPVTLAPGGRVRLTARVLDAHGNVRADAVTWSLLAAGAGTLNAQTGDFTASATTGTYTNALRAEAGGRTALATVTIQSGALAQLLLTPASASLRVGASVAFSARGLDANGNEVALSPSWDVVNGGGGVSATGTFTAGSVAGTYPDTVRVSAEGLSASASVTVTPGPGVAVSLSPTSPTLPARGTVQFTARATDAFGNELTSSPRTWSAQAAAGSITASGLFTAGTTPGFHQDAVQVEVDGVKAKTSVEVSARVARVEVTSPMASALPAGGSALFTARAFDASGTELTDVTFTWSAQAAAGSIDSSGRLTVACTRASISAAVKATAEGVSGSVDATIVTGPAFQLTVSPASVTLDAGSATSFTASTQDRCGNLLAPPSVTWSTASGAGTITPAGQYTAPCTVGSLTSAVMASSGSLSASANVTVRPGALASLTLDPTSATLAVTESQQFSARGVDSCGNTLSLALNWAVTAGGGSVNGSGLFTAGTVAGSYPNTLEVSASGRSARASLTVRPGPLAVLSLSPREVDLAPGSTVKFTLLSTDRFGNAVAVSPTWSVVAGGGTLDATGTFTAGSTAGTYTDTVRAQASGFTASATVTVLVGATARVELTPTSISLAPGQKQHFTARAYDVFGNLQDASFTWSVAAPEVGEIDGNGDFTAGHVAGTYPEAVRVSAGGRTAVATVTVVAGPTASVELSPLSPEVRVGGTVRFTARALDAYGNVRPGALQWSVRPEVGSITSEGIFTAGDVPGDYASAVTVTHEDVSNFTSVRVLAAERPDAGTGGGTSPDAGTGSDAGTDIDAGTDTGPTPGTPAPGGCGCSSASEASAPLTALLLLALAVMRRRGARA